MKKLTRIIFLLFTIPFLFCGCDQDDDINEIFDSGIWYFVNYYKYVDWDSNNDRSARPVYTKPDDLKVISQFSIKFETDGTFSGTLHGGGSYSGRWEANPKGRTFSVIGRIKTNGDLSGKNGEYIKTLENAMFYNGDSQNMLRLAPDSRTNCIQFSHLKPFK